jgi:hypothetical protein
MFSTVAPSQTWDHPCDPQSFGSILRMFCGRLVRINRSRSALADDVQGLIAPPIRHLVVPEITQRHAENTTPFSGRCRLAIPAVWSAASCFAGAPTWTAPLHAAIPRIFLRFGVAVVTCRADLGAAHPRIVGVVAPFDSGCLPHSEAPCLPVVTTAKPVGAAVSAALACRHTKITMPSLRLADGPVAPGRCIEPSHGFVPAKTIEFMVLERPLVVGCINTGA